MASRLSVNKVLTVIGLILAWTPLVFPVLLSVIKLMESGVFLFDFLMPAEMFLIFLSGAVLLFWISLRTKYYMKHIGLGLLSAVLLLFTGQGIAVVTGLASGDIESKGWPFILVLTAIVLYISAVVETGIAGLCLLRKISSNPAVSSKSNNS
ncbi:hypothetical protein ACSFC1_00155 [Pseudothermotoga sp. U03pept]|uniref:hypothetical protein n=1 Tax=Pseudothermotoga sp. U03pept TaxID=3447012 RepID=UPI003F0CC15A